MKVQENLVKKITWVRNNYPDEQHGDYGDELDELYDKEEPFYEIELDDHSIAEDDGADYQHGEYG